MKYISFILILFTLFIYSHKAFSIDDALTMKQQIERIVEELKDLNKAVFNKSFDNEKLYSTNDQNYTERFTSIDIRIYDLENDIKNLTFQLEEITFRLDEIFNKINSMELEFNTKLKENNSDLKNENLSINQSDNFKENLLENKNTLGTIVISENDDSLLKPTNSSLDVSEKNNETELEVTNLTPEEELQSGIDQLRKKNYSKSKKIFENFINNNLKNNLSGTAHYWLGKIYLFEKNYRNAALTFGEGVQNFPKSIKAAEMSYELVIALSEMGKNDEACKTFLILKDKYKNSKFVKDPKQIVEKLNCETNN